MTPPVSAHAEIDITADERTVWTVLADIGAWPTWNPAVRDAIFEEELEVGAAFRFSTPFGSIKCRLVEVDAPRALVWTGRLLTVREQQTWRIDSTESGTHATNDSVLCGLGARLFRSRLAARLQGELDAQVRLLKLEAEVRVAEEREAETRRKPADG